jgi:hypothetical protein
MLSSAPEKAKNTVLCPKPEIKEDTQLYESDFLITMIDQLGLVTSVFHKRENEIFKGQGQNGAVQ